MNAPSSSAAASATVTHYTIIGESAPAESAGGITDADASRFLAQASMGASRAEIASVRALGYAGWIEAQFALPPTTSRWNWLLANGADAEAYRNTQHGFDAASWYKLLASPDTLRQRIAFALSEILVVGIDGLSGGWRAFAAAYYQDLLERNAFGNFRDLLRDVTLSPAMGEWLTYRGNAKANPTTGALPDENYAREIMQLFTIGLVQLNQDGTPQAVGGMPQPTYTQEDVMGLARVWTGWNWDAGGLTGAAAQATPDYQGRPMRQFPARCETGEKRFLGSVIAAGSDGYLSMEMALDTLFAHPNVGPFIGRQLIQRLVTSNPSPAYVARAAAAFNRDGTGVRGSLRAVVRAILLDAEARDPAHAADPAFGKLREPILRFVAWARAFGAQSTSAAWRIGNTSDPATRLGQSPLRSPSVFNFFRPGYVPPNTALGRAGLAAPEFQITNATSVVGYVNFMQRVVSSGAADYSGLLPLADRGAALLGEINIVLAGGRIGAAGLGAMAAAIDAMSRATPVALNNRIYAALLMVLASPEFIVQK
jgi:uncharacterized protein (DUF1800 family)